jgi:hypothetical protein
MLGTFPSAGGGFTTDGFIGEIDTFAFSTSLAINGFSAIVTGVDVACYCAGVMILTESGEVAVEDLRIGDRLVTLYGSLKPAETFVDNVERMCFDNWAEHEALHPGDKPIRELPYPRAKGRRQVPRRLRAALDARALEIMPERAAAVA